MPGAPVHFIFGENITTKFNRIATAVATAEVKMSLKNDIKIAYEALKANKDDSKIKSDIDVMSASRKQAIENAMAIFKTEIQAARVELKLAFGVK